MQNFPEPNITVAEWVFGPSHGAQIILQCMRENPEIFLQKSVLDIWCGSGILWISAAQLRAGRVCASDINSKAIENTLENARNNWVIVDARKWSYWEPFGEEKFDIVIANLPQDKHTWSADMRWNEAILAFLPKAENLMKEKESILILGVNGCTPYKETLREIRKNWKIEKAKGMWIGVKWWVQEHIHLFLDEKEATLRKKDDNKYETPIFYLVLRKKS